MLTSMWSVLMHLSACPCSVFGISPIIQSNCSYTWKLIVNPELKWYHFVNPIMLLTLYYTLATLIRLWLQEPIDQLVVRTADSNAARAHESRPFQLTTFLLLNMPIIWRVPHHMFITLCEEQSHDSAGSLQVLKNLKSTELSSLEKKGLRMVKCLESKS